MKKNIILATMLSVCLCKIVFSNPMHFDQRKKRIKTIDLPVNIIEIHSR